MDEADSSAVPLSFRILVAEAEPDLRAAIERLLRPLGHVDLVADGSAALEAIGRRLPDLLLLDTSAPGVDGTKWLRALRAGDRTRDLRVMMLVERGSPLADAEDALADDYLSKSFSAREIVARVRTQLLVCRQRSSLRATEAARRRSEERLRVTLDNVPSNVALYSHDYRVLYVNPALAALCPKPASEVVGMHADEFGASLAEPLKSHISRAIATGERQIYELATEPSGGPRLVKEWTIVPLAGADGEMPQVLVLTHDITAQRQLVEELRESDRRKSEFIAVLSHELRNPLAAIRTHLYVAERVPTSEPAARALRVIDRQVGQLARMVDDLLDVTRITQRKIQLQRSRIDLEEVVRQTIEDNRSTLERSGVQLDTQFVGAPIWVDADAARIAQIVTNLLANAVKFTPSGGTVSVSVSADLPGARAVLRVSDTGTGIDPALLGRLFEPFMQAERTLDRTIGGLGLGLALVKGLVDLHGGEVSARSDGLGRGAEFTVRLPLASMAPLETGPSAAQSPPGVRHRVLVIEDDADIADGLQAALETDEQQVVIARNGAEGLEKARDYLPDVVLCDIGLPGMSGYDVARAFRSDDALRATFLVALSGYAQAEDVDRARAAGFDRHIAKPPTVEKLMRIFADADRR